MAISKEIWSQIKATYEAGKYEEEKVFTELALEFEVNRSTISKKAKSEGWIYGKNSHLIRDEIDIIEKKSHLIHTKITLNEFELEVHDNIVMNKTMRRNLVFNASTLGLLRLNQLMEQGTKLEKINMGQGMQQMIEVGMGASDYLDCINGIDKASITLGVNERHAKSQVNIDNTNAMQNNIEENQITISIKD